MRGKAYVGSDRDAMQVPGLIVQPVERVELEHQLGALFPYEIGGFRLDLLEKIVGEGVGVGDAVGAGVGTVKTLK